MTRGTEDARRIAADPTTDWSVLYEIAQTNPEVHPEIAANPAAYPDLLAWLGSLGKPDVDAALARRAAAGAPAVSSAAGPSAAGPSAAPAELERTAVSPPAVSPPAASPETQVIQQPWEPEAPPAYAPTAAAAQTFGQPPVERIPAAQTFGQPPVERIPVARTFGQAPVETAPWQPPVQRPGTPETGRSRRPLVAILVVVGILAAVGIGWFLGRDDPPDGTATAPSTVSPTAGSTTPAPPDTLAPDSRAALDAAVTQLAATIEASGCTDPDADARAFLDYATVRLTTGPWGEDANQNALEEIARLQTRCNAGHAVAVADRAAAQSPDLAAALGGRGWVVPTTPAPADAADITAFSSPSGNIACTLGEDWVTCSIAQYTFGSPGACPDPAAPVTAVVDGGARADCGVGAVTGGPGLAYGTSARHSHFACTSAESGVTCWDTWTGARIRLARATLEIGGPVFGSVG